MELDPKALALFKEGYDKIIAGLRQLGYDTEDANFKETARRAAKGLHELVHDQKQARKEIEGLLSTMLPVIYRISMAYIPVEKVLGVSKLTRLARLVARGPRLQEDLTHELADLLHLDL